MSEQGHSPPDQPEDAQPAFENLLDSLAVETEHRDLSRLEAFRETLVALLEDNGRRFSWTAEEYRREWMREAIGGIDRRLQRDD
jgi:hypothetical protein